MSKKDKKKKYIGREGERHLWLDRTDVPTLDNNNTPRTTLHSHLSLIAQWRKVKCNYAQWRKAKFNYAQWRKVKCNYAQWRKAKCNYAHWRKVFSF